MRLLCLFIVLIWAAIGFSQDSHSASLFRTLRPDGIIVVRQHKLGAQIIEITMQDPSYSLDVLKAQAEQIGANLNSTVRGLQLTRHSLWDNDPNPPLPRATFAVDGLVDEQNRIYKLQPIIRAFASSDKPAVNGLSIQFDRLPPGKNTLRRFSSKAVIVEASDQVQPQIGVEYRVQYLSHDPNAIDVPETPQPAPKPQQPKKVVSTDWVLWGIALVAACALGALVYSVLSRGRPSGPASR